MVRPVDIFDHDGQRRACGSGLEQSRDELEQPAPPRVTVKRADNIARRDGQREEGVEKGRSLREVRPQPLDGGQCLLGACFGVVRRADAKHRVQEIDPGSERVSSRVRVAVAAVNVPAPGVQVVLEVKGQVGFPHPRFPGDDHGPTAATLYLAAQPSKGLDLGLAAKKEPRLFGSPNSDHRALAFKRADGYGLFLSLHPDGRQLPNVEARPALDCDVSGYKNLSSRG